MKYCLAIINNEVLSFAITSIKLYGSILSAVS